MNFYFKKVPYLIGFLTLMVSLCTEVIAQYSMNGTIKSDTIYSKTLSQNKIGLNTERGIRVYLPPDYFNTRKRYPVVYYLHNIFESPDVVLSDCKTAEIVDREIENNRCRELILVVADFTSPTIGSLFENSSTSGYWLDFICKEIVPHVDANYRTIPEESSRAVIGYFLGGRGALKLAMSYPQLFSVVYALHPVATGSGYLPRSHLDVDWEKILLASSYKDLEGSGRTQIFASICQAFLPNPNRPPLYADFLFEKDDSGALAFHAKNARKELQLFHLDERLDEYAENLRGLRAIAFDWARFDQTQAHVISNRRFSKKLMEFGVNHEAEEFAGDPQNRYWGANGRFSTRVLPFLNKHLKF